MNFEISAAQPISNHPQVDERKMRIRCSDMKTGFTQDMWQTAITLPSGPEFKPGKHVRPTPSRTQAIPVEPASSCYPVGLTSRTLADV
jgi:hypothetical protein